MDPSPFRPDLLAGRRALVTGGGTGIGLAVARELGRQGAEVHLASRKAEVLAKVAAGLSGELGRPVHARVLDLRERDGIEGVVRALVEEHGPIDILVNNGGGQFLASAETIRPRGWDAVLATNLTGTWELTRQVALQGMLQRGGAVVNVTMLTSRGFPGMAHSVAARAGVEGMSRTLAVEWAQAGIRVNCVAPGIIASSGLHNYPAGLSLGWQLQTTIPMKRLGTVQEVAWAVAFLAGPASAYITGQTLTVCGGRSLWGDGWPIPDPEPLPEVVLPVEAWEEEG